jgi:exonuclease SbcC
MIKSLVLKNFQSHKDSTLEFDPGVNVVIGKSDTGKSVILRALRWLIWNRPLGNDFRSTWGGKTWVEAHLDFPPEHSDKVSRIKDKEEVYFGNKIEHKAFRSDVPEEVRKILNIGDINVQHQFAGPFLLAQETSPGDVAKHFNKVAKLDKIDDGVKNINSWIRQIEQNIKAHEMNIESSEAKLKDYDHLEKFEAEVEALEQLEKQYHAKMSNIVILEDLVEDIKEVDRDIACEKVYLEMEAEVTAILDLIYKRDALEDGPITDISGILQELSAVNDSIKDEKQILQELEEQFEKEFPKICPLCGTNLKK